MDQSSPPGIRQFLSVVYQDWTALYERCGHGSLYLTATLLPSHWGYTRPIFGVMAGRLFSVTVYRVRATERTRRIALEQDLAPRLRLEFDPNQPKFVSLTPALGGFEMLYVRVLA